MASMKSLFISNDGTKKLNHLKENKNLLTRHYNTTEKMPINDFKQDILNMINSSSTLIIRGLTGCGKTTQVPQFIMDEAERNNVYCNIIVTQPRRIAAISIAKRVCSERNWELGSICGYQVGLETNTSSATILNYVTNGILLQKLIRKQNLDEYTHIIIDEVHERTQEVDFLLLLARRFMRTISPNVKLVLMSATFDTDKFASYFRIHNMGIDIPAPTLYINKERKYALYLFYLEQLNRGHRTRVSDFDIDHPEVKSEMLDLMVYLIKEFEMVDRMDSATNKKEIGHVLVFLPGYYEIEEAYSKLVGSKSACNINTEWVILPLHSMNTTAEQERVFIKAGLNQRKIILSTNIAESSLTLIDVEYVIDFCLTKTLVIDPITKYQSLKLQWASKVNCNQRAGRVARVRDGKVYRLIPQRFYNDELPQEIPPEMVTAPLERVVLGAKLLDIEQPPKTVLALAIDPPNLDTIDATILNLKEVGALLLTYKGYYTKLDGDLTFLGRIMFQLPLDVKLSKLIVLGYMFSCLDECIIMAAASSLSNVFKTPFQERLRSYNNKLMWADGSCSDLIAYLNLYKVWQRNKSSGAFRNNKEKDWCKSYFLSNKSLREWDKLVDELKDRLNMLGITNVGGPSRVVLSHLQLPIIVKIAICGAFYPNYFKRTVGDGENFERLALKEVNGLDPMRTIYFTNMDSKQPGPLYAKTIKQALQHCSINIDVHFDSSSKVYVTFKESPITQLVFLNGKQFLTTIPGKIPMGVFRAVRLRQLKSSTEIHTISNYNVAWEQAELKGIARKNDFDQYELINKKAEIKSNALPSLNDITISLSICYVIDAGHFYAQPLSDEVKKNLLIIHDILNSKDELQKISGTPKIDEWYAAKYEEDDCYYRCKVIELTPGSKNTINVQIFFIDFGNIQEVSYSSLYQIPKGEALELAPQVLECVLCEVKPSVVKNSNGLWPREANQTLKIKATNCVFNGKVYSVLNNVVSLELFVNNEPMSFNTWLIKNDYGQHAEESILSKEDNQRRLTAQKLVNSDSKECTGKHYIYSCKDVEPPPINDCHTTFQLRGPHSPLEFNVQSMTKVTKTVNIDGHSVNTVLLDTDPQDNFERILVSAGISQSTHSETLALRDTTMMPNILGLPMLMALLFCPRMVPKPTADGAYFAAVLCGLGASKTSFEPFYPDHDIIVNLDTDLTTEDITEINDVRFWMNKTVRCMAETANKEIPTTSLEVCQRALHERLFNILHKPRTAQERKYVSNVDDWYDFEYKGEKIEPCGTNLENEIWPMLWTMKLKTEMRKRISMKEHLSTMSEMAMNIIPMTKISCKLCHIDIHSVADMRTHLSSQSHLVKKNKFMITP